jgi:RNA polymerase sigma factor (sigma-70 family)
MCDSHPFEQAAQNERAWLVMDCCLRALTRRQFEVLSLLYGQDGMTQVEVAAVFGVSKVAVSRIHARALRALRAELTARKVFALWQI